MPTPATCAQSYCTEAARAAALASHSAASLAAAAGFREAARLLRSSEALARAATAALLAVPRLDVRVPGPGHGAGDIIMEKKKRANKKKKGKQATMEEVFFGPELPPPASGVPEVAPAASTATVSPGKAARVLVARNSRERSPHGARAAPSSASPSASSHHVPASVSTGTGKFAVGQAVALFGLVSRADLVGKCGVVKSFDSAATRYAVCIDVSSEMVTALEAILRPSVFVSGGGFG